MTIESLYPYAGNHAVQNAIFVVEWSDPLRAEDLKGVSKLANRFKTLGLSHVQHQLGVEIKLEHGVGAPTSGPVGTQTLNAITFARPAAVGEISRSVTVSRQNCMIAIPDYSRWNQVFEDVTAYLKVVLDDIAPKKSLSVIGIQYNDVFNWKDHPSELNLRDVFRDDGFIPVNAFEQKGLWHVHHGFMDRRDLPVPYACLQNVNVDMIDAAGERVIQIVGSHRATLGESLWQSHMKNKSVMLEVFAALHQANKQMLQKLLTKQVCEKIRLTAE